MEADTDEEEIEVMALDDGRECHWRMVFEENEVGRDDDKSLLYDKRWDV